MAILKHITSKNADYGEAQRYLMFQYDEAAMKPVLDESGRMIPREEYYLDGIPLLFPTIEEATLLALDAMVCVALAVPAAVFFPFFAAWYAFRYWRFCQNFCRIPLFAFSAFFAACPAVFPLASCAVSCKRRPVPFSRNSDSCRRAFLLCIPRLVRCIVYRRALLVTGQPAVLSLSPLIYCDVFSFSQDAPLLSSGRPPAHPSHKNFLPHICGRTALSTLLSRYSIKFSQGEARLSHT